ncbi:hypothetical protein WR25_17885 [Diploscapter pachys]|uniref:Uncharacterized protein n=1 Tax=Diploscapter pachys TaxID=2018661 RepID=A0A2A2JYZ1_9BILA|nr:hypothetical protein WR25_17885 [Diploscapter pachys]
MVERQVHSVPRLGVGILEVQLRIGWQATASAAKGNPRTGQASCASAWRNAGGNCSPKRTRPSAWLKMPIRCSQASNSGAGFKPSDCRA